MKKGVLMWGSVICFSVGLWLGIGSVQAASDEPIKIGSTEPLSGTFKDIGEISDEEWETSFKTNIHAMFYLTKAAVPHMKPGSAIINTASINSDMPNPILLAYATTKGAIQNFTGGLAQMLAKKDIRVNAVAPGFINMLSHAQISLLVDGRSQSDIRQGVTLEVIEPRPCRREMEAGSGGQPRCRISRKTCSRRR